MDNDISVVFEHLKNRDLEYLKEIDVFAFRKLARLAAIEGDIESLKFLHENDLFKDVPMSEVIEGAIVNDNLECLIFLHEIGYQLTLSYFYNSIKFNSLECMKYLIENNCPYELREILPLIRYNCFESFKCLHEIDFFNGETKKILCGVATGAGNYDLLKFYHEHGYDWNEEILKICIISYKNAKRANDGIYNIDLFTTSNYLNCITYLLENSSSISLEDEIYQDEEVQEIIRRVED